MLFVHFKEGNDRYFLESKSKRSDLEIYFDQIDTACMKECKVFLYTPLAHEIEYPIYETVKRLLVLARDEGALVAYDPNYRFPYKTPAEHMRVKEAIKAADILKLTIEEMQIILGENDAIHGMKNLLEQNAKIVAVTMGGDGCLLGNKRGIVYCPAYHVQAEDTTGAGDSFMGALLYSITRNGCCAGMLEKEELKSIGQFCNACAAGCTMQRGSLLVMPDMEKALKLMQETPENDSDFEKWRLQ